MLPALRQLNPDKKITIKGEFAPEEVDRYKQLKKAKPGSLSGADLDFIGRYEEVQKNYFDQILSSDLDNENGNFGKEAVKSIIDRRIEITKASRRKANDLVKKLKEELEKTDNVDVANAIKEDIKYVESRSEEFSNVIQFLIDL